MFRQTLAIAVVLAANLLTGCASQKSATLKPVDPFERLNRRVYAFNAAFDRRLATPASRTYRNVTPAFVRTGISNFVDNLSYPAVIVNDALQGKGVPAMRDTGRFVINSTVGVVGFFDLATRWGLEENSEDLSQTLGRWGVGSGPYLILPFSGPTTLRDGLAKIIDPGTSPLAYVENSAVSSGVSVMRLANSGSGSSGGFDTESMALSAYDPYLVTRSLYLQRRFYLVHDGFMPEDTFELDYTIDAQTFRQASIELGGEVPFELAPLEEVSEIR